ncbi:hypothetical protein ASC75_08020 [Aminobacter sp. DSM 101952]|nr:hypothetical protein ASC75_08020 [Aminobacter sp. DSM 101952]CAI2934387.1 conserved protein of unknown function [Aminobacter niigataensis]
MFGTSLTKGQVDGAERVLDEAQRRGTPLRHLAYILATAYNETAHTMQPIREISSAQRWVLATQKDAFSLFMLVFSNLQYRIRLVQPASIS